jgi:hypothetical protein
MTVLAFAPPSFSDADRAALRAFRASLARPGRSVVLEFVTEDPEDAGGPAGEYASLELSGDAFTSYALQTTREPGRRFVLIGPDGRERIASGELREVLARIG